MKRKGLVLLTLLFMLTCFSPGFAASGTETPSQQPAETTAEVSKTQSNPEKVKMWGEKDPYGFSMALIAMSVVFSALLILYLAFKGIGAINKKMEQKAAAATEDEAETSQTSLSADTEAEVVAAIVMALEQSTIHDEETGIVTIRHHLTEWNAKNNTMCPLPKA